MVWHITVINVFLSCVLSYLIAPIIKNLGIKYNIIDLPNLRKIHILPIVRIGGLSIFFIFFFLLFVYIKSLGINILSNGVINPLFIILIGSFFYFLIGLHDDIFKSSPFLRLILQFSVALAVSNYGVNFGSINFSIPYYGEINIILPAYIDHILTSFWIVGITNAINWIDGMDGLAAGYTSILSLGLCTLMLIQGNFIGILFFSLLLGSILGFLIRNFKPAYYIMGDCGSNFLGFCLSASSLVFLRDLKFDSINFFFLILIFSLPIIDMLIVITRRILRGKSIFRPDRSHFHHKLMDWNFDYKEIIFINYFYSTITICAGIFYQNQF